MKRSDSYLTLPLFLSLFLAISSPSVEAAQRTQEGADYIIDMPPSLLRQATQRSSSEPQSNSSGKEAQTVREQALGGFLDDLSTGGCARKFWRGLAVTSEVMAFLCSTGACFIVGADWGLSDTALKRAAFTLTFAASTFTLITHRAHTAVAKQDKAMASKLHTLGNAYKDDKLKLMADNLAAEAKTYENESTKGDVHPSVNGASHPLGGVRRPIAGVVNPHLTDIPLHPIGEVAITHDPFLTGAAGAVTGPEPIEAGAPALGFSSLPIAPRVLPKSLDVRPHVQMPPSSRAPMQPEVAATSQPDPTALEGRLSEPVVHFDVADATAANASERKKTDKKAREGSGKKPNGQGEEFRV